MTTPEVTAEHAKVAVRTRLVSESANGSKIVLHTTLYSASNAAVGESQASAELQPGDSIVANQEIAVDRPALWSPEPRCSIARSRAWWRAGKTLDEVSTPFGIRSLEWSAEKGLLLNGTA